MKLSGAKLPLRDTMAAAILDRLSWLVWAQSEDAVLGRNYPKSVLSALMEGKKPEESSGFEDAEDYEAEWERITGVKHGWK